MKIKKVVGICTVVMATMFLAACKGETSLEVGVNSSESSEPFECTRRDTEHHVFVKCSRIEINEQPKSLTNPLKVDEGLRLQESSVKRFVQNPLKVETEKEIYKVGNLTLTRTITTSVREISTKSEKDEEGG